MRTIWQLTGGSVRKRMLRWSWTKCTSMERYCRVKSLGKSCNKELSLSKASGDAVDETKNAPRANITYGIDDTPPWYLCIPMAFQHYLTMIGAIVSIPFILTPALCMENEDPARGQIISTMIFVTGLVTFLQVTWGCRLPIVQVGFELSSMGWRW